MFRLAQVRAGRRVLTRASQISRLTSKYAAVTIPQGLQRFARLHNMASVPGASPVGEAAPALKVLRRLDYAPVPFTVRKIDLKFDIHPGCTHVTAEMAMEQIAAAPAPIVLNKGDPAIQTLKSVTLNGSPATYSEQEKTITVQPPSAGASTFTLALTVDIKPEENTSLEGLYRSGSAYSTQCEAEGFRNIIPYLDRPDVMSVYTVRIEAGKAACPVLLSNGNLVEQGEVEGGARHYVVWHDPFPKPCYLFALVAGELTGTFDSFTTCTGKSVALKFWTSAKDADKVGWAIESLKKAMKWDEVKFGREYDLDQFNVVAVSDFNMGAMENKSLNIFNSRLVLASAKTASDVDYNRIEGVVAHEYFHNWSGNRVTCRDWFQLTLKEGLTVYRDQEFTADHNSRPVKRIEDVARLRVSQFPEDAGPTAHSIRPEQVGKMDNFYTATVYEKGAEIIRLYATVLGQEGFRKGMDLYFTRHDGQAVTCDEFYQAMYDANPGHPGLSAMPALKVWYGQAGTPELTVTPSYDAGKQTLTLTASQKTPATAGQATKEPVLLPIAVGLVGKDGADIPLVLDGQAVTTHGGKTAVLCLTQEKQAWTFTGVPEGVVPSVLRNFSAPVRMTVVGQTDADLAFLFAHDSDPFNRWEAGQRLGKGVLTSFYASALQAAQGKGSNEEVKAAVYAALDSGKGTDASLTALSTAFSSILSDVTLDGAYLARAISLPSETELVDGLAANPAYGHADPLVVHHVRNYVCHALATKLRGTLQSVIAAADAAIGGTAYSPDFQAVARRAIRNKALAYLSCIGDDAITADLQARYLASTNMTDSVANLAALTDLPPGTPAREQALAHFYDTFKEEPLVLLKWLGLQAMSAQPGTTAAVRALMSHSAFSITNPNACYSLFGGFASATPAFHAPDGSGYAFIADIIKQVDAVNPQVASRIATFLSKYRAYDAPRQAAIRAQLQALAGGKLSENVGEIVARSLAA